MKDKRVMAPMVWEYIKSRETARRMGTYAGEVTGRHPHFAFDSSARARDLGLETIKAYAGPKHITAEDLGYSGDALKMEVPTYQAPGEFVNLARL